MIYRVCCGLHVQSVVVVVVVVVVLLLLLFCGKFTLQCFLLVSWQNEKTKKLFHSSLMPHAS